MLEDESPFVEDVGLSNLKLIIGFGSVAASVVSHVYPAPFPKNWWVLLGCCLWYFIGSGLLQLLLSFVELESIVLLRYKDKERRGNRAAGINVTSHFPRYDHVYTLGITPLPSGSLALFSAPKFKLNPTPKGEELPQADYAQIHWSANACANCPGFVRILCRLAKSHCLRDAVAEFFDEEGVFFEDKCMDMTRQFLDNYERESKRLADEEAKKTK
eukprot:scaffold132258_cov28-Tisochrysis_lutea.AAC.1